MMRVWLCKNPDSFGRGAPEWYGWEGDANICAVIVAQTETDARAMLLQAAATVEGASVDPDEYADWTVEEITPTGEQRILAFVYGAY